jgi:glycine/D-amino acid oxidase-like deaminating enzyme/nitrite reductase/ring-hydroxylating ferredoxin subunit
MGSPSGTRRRPRLRTLRSRQTSPLTSRSSAVGSWESRRPRWLSATGRRVALLEAETLGAGVTGHTTAKVTSLHTLIYADLVNMFGDEQARRYGEANEAGLATIRRLCAERRIDCELAEATAYTYADRGEDADRIEQEVEAATSVGLPATYEEEPPLPFRTFGAVGLAAQARFHPRKYLLSLAASLEEGGCLVFEHTRAVEVEDRDPWHVRTTSGSAVSAEHVILATHAPIVDVAVLVARAKAMRGYALAVEAGDFVPGGMFITAGAPSRSVRGATLDGKDVLIISGEGHPVGEADDPRTHWHHLERWARDELRSGDVIYRWSTQDYYSLDRVPFVGALKGTMYAATAFGGWGMTNGTAAAMLLGDLVNEVENPWQELYDPWRLKMRSVPALVKKGGHDIKRFVGDRLGGESGLAALDGLKADTAQVVDVGDERLAAYRDPQGELHVVSAVCTHLGCVVNWNDAERSWDCPCHGSRFAIDGRVLNGPAVEALADKNDVLAAAMRG